MIYVFAPVNTFSSPPLPPMTFTFSHVTLGNVQGTEKESKNRKILSIMTPDDLDECEEILHRRPPLQHRYTMIIVREGAQDKGRDNYGTL